MKLTEDPIRPLIDALIAEFGSERDRRIWSWYAVRLGVETMVLVAGELADDLAHHPELRRKHTPAKLFHHRIKVRLNIKTNGARRR